jgi:hypothetical protein
MSQHDLQYVQCTDDCMHAHGHAAWPCGKATVSSFMSQAAWVTMQEAWWSLLVGGVVVWLAGHAHLSCLNLRQWITIGVDVHSFLVVTARSSECAASMPWQPCDISKQWLHSSCRQYHQNSSQTVAEGAA